jgi:two-component system, cell cycle sensor histidine kinase and response regulator CckA
MADVQSNQLFTSTASSTSDFRTLLLAQKTEVIGELTRAIVNQFNNTMMAITSYAELELKNQPAKKRRSLEQVLSNTARATGLVQKLLGISSNPPPSNEALDLNAVLTGIGSLIEQIAGERISVAYKLESGIPGIFADRTQVEQLALSLAINARNAISDGGKLVFATKSVDLITDSAGESERPGKYVMFAVDDTGAARPVEPDNRKSSTNIAQDLRMNLSLATVHAIAKNAEAIARFVSDPGKGSSFKIYFPAMPTHLSEQREPKVSKNVPLARTILIVEDDDAVRVPTAELLKMEGFKVLQARTGEEAIHVVLQNRASLDVLVTDVVMPQMTGHEVARKLREINPQLKILFISGEDLGAVNSAGNEKDAVLRKPFRLEALKEKIHGLLQD